MRAIFGLAMLTIVTVLIGNVAAEASTFDAAAATQNYLKLHAESCLAKNANCDASAGSIINWPNIALVILLFGLFFSGAAKRLQDIIKRFTHRIWLQSIICGILAALLLVIIDFSAKAVFSSSSFERGWLSWLDQFLAMAVFASFALAFVHILLCRLGKRSWIVFALLLSGYSVYDTGSSRNFQGVRMQIPQGEARDRIAAMAKAENFPMSRIVLGRPKVFDSWHSAEVAGMPWSPIIMLGDGFQPDLPPSPGRSANGHPLVPLTDKMMIGVVGHELAHVRQNHVAKLLGIQIVMTLLFCWLTFWILGRVLLRSKAKYYETDFDQWSIITLFGPLFFVFLNLSSYVFIPMKMMTEREADAVGFAISKEPDGFADLLFSSSKGGPIRYGDWTQLLVRTHPSEEERIRAAMEWKAKNLSELGDQLQLTPSPSVVPDKTVP